MGENMKKRQVIFYTKLNDVGFRDINPLFCGEEKCGTMQTYGPTIRQHYLLHYVISGRGTFERDGKMYEVKEGQIFVIKPGEYTTYSANREDPWHYYYVSFYSRLNLSESLGEPVITAPLCVSLFGTIVCSSDIGEGREWLICAKIFEILAILNKNTGTAVTREQRIVQLAKGIIEDRYQGELTVAKIARELNLDRTYFSKIFRKWTGKPPQQFLVEYRLIKAAELMISLDFTPGEAASYVGYKDIFNFSKMFKSKFGIPPSHYKKAASEGNNL